MSFVKATVAALTSMLSSQGADGEFTSGEGNSGPSPFNSRSHSHEVDGLVPLPQGVGLCPPQPLVADSDPPKASWFGSDSAPPKAAAQRAIRWGVTNFLKRCGCSLGMLLSVIKFCRISASRFQFGVDSMECASNIQENVVNAHGFDGIFHVGIIDRRHERRTGVSRKSAQATEAMKNFMGGGWECENRRAKIAGPQHIFLFRVVRVVPDLFTLRNLKA